MKKIIRLTENDLHNIIKNSTKKILKEAISDENWKEVLDESLNSMINKYGTDKVLSTMISNMSIDEYRTIIRKTQQTFTKNELSM